VKEIVLSLALSRFLRTPESNDEDNALPTWKTYISSLYLSDSRISTIEIHAALDSRIEIVGVWSFQIPGNFSNAADSGEEQCLQVCSRKRHVFHRVVSLNTEN
jgi:hypothetical protein